MQGPRYIYGGIYPYIFLAETTSIYRYISGISAVLGIYLVYIWVSEIFYKYIFGIYLENSVHAFEIFRKIFGEKKSIFYTMQNAGEILFFVLFLLPLILRDKLKPK